MDYLGVGIGHFMYLVHKAIVKYSDARRPSQYRKKLLG
jgi:hypothetical protein